MYSQSYVVVEDALYFHPVKEVDGDSLSAAGSRTHLLGEALLQVREDRGAGAGTTRLRVRTLRTALGGTAPGGRDSRVCP